MSFQEVLAAWPKKRVMDLIAACTEKDVYAALQSAELNIHAFAALISPAAVPFLEDIAQKARQLRLQRHGNAMFLYAPLYLSNVCQNACRYCGFSAQHRINRTTLTEEQIDAECIAIAKAGFRHLLLLTGEAPQHLGMEYLVRAAEICRQHIPALDIEVWPLTTDEYRQSFEAGIAGVTVYQETYDAELYPEYHPAGRKSDYAFRLGTPERAGEAGMRRIGIGALMGLSEWRYDAFCTALHAQFLTRQFWQSNISVSFPRLRPMAGAFSPYEIVDDRAIIQYMCALRCFGPDMSMTLSTREAAAFRDRIIHLGVTRISAQSSTAPGGYAAVAEGEEQFAISDDRSLTEIMAMLQREGFDPVFKDWDEAAARVLNSSKA